MSKRKSGCPKSFDQILLLSVPLHHVYAECAYKKVAIALRIVLLQIDSVS